MSVQVLFMYSKNLLSVKRCAGTRSGIDAARRRDALPCISACMNALYSVQYMIFTPPPHFPDNQLVISLSTDFEPFVIYYAGQEMLHTFGRTLTPVRTHLRIPAYTSPYPVHTSSHPVHTSPHPCVHVSAPCAHVSAPLRTRLRTPAYMSLHPVYMSPHPAYTSPHPCVHISAPCGYIYIN